MNLQHYLTAAAQHIEQWQDTWGPFEQHRSLQLDPAAIDQTLRAYAERLTGNYPFFHPRYAGQMLKPPHPAAVVGYLAAMLINPNNHALDGGPPTSAMEKELIPQLAAMFGLPAEHLGHLTSSGTIANLEALWVARELHPAKKIACSEAAHYTHTRMGQVLGVEVVIVPTDAAGRIDLDALEQLLQHGEVGTVVLSIGTTGLGAVDPVAEAVPLCQRYGCRLHIDGAYGGFFTLLAWADDPALDPAVRAHFRAVGQCDSVVVDPHKHGLQPYGCGAILFRDPAVGRFYRHDSPYTYFTSDELHLGEISLECSRAGAAAGALWFTLQLLPLQAEQGLGSVLRATRQAAKTWAARLEDTDHLGVLLPPELDIINFFPRPERRTASALDAASQRLFEATMHDPDDPLFFGTLRVPTADVQRTVPDLVADQPTVRVIRSVLMKPEHEAYVAHLHARVEAMTAQDLGNSD